MTHMKTHILKWLGVSMLLLVTINASAQTFDELSNEMTKEQLLEVYTGLFENSDDLQKTSKKATEDIMRKNLGDEKFAEFQENSAKMEVQSNIQQAKCLGVSTDELDAAKQAVDADFQLEVVHQCSSKLPDIIRNPSLGDPADSPDMKLFSDCMNNKTAEKMGVSQEQIQQCAHLR